MTAYYNEIDPAAAQWLRNLIEAGHIAPGYVDERSIEDVFPSDLRGFTQCHFFAGIGVWSHALRQSGWSDDGPVWTGSCPCQPFSTAGKGAGFDDERHLWPAFHHLIKECKPSIVFGEQVASKDTEPWLDLVQTDLEALDYAFGAVPFPSAGVSAPHIRERLYWVADTNNTRLEGWETVRQRADQCAFGEDSLDDKSPTSGPTNNFWRNADWLLCRDGKWRPVEPGYEQMVDGSASSLGRVCASAIEEIEGEVNGWEDRHQADGSEAMRRVWKNLREKAQCEREVGRFSGVQSPSVLLAFLRQLTEQGWRFSDALALEGARAPQVVVRVMRFDAGAARTPLRRELAEQHAGQPTDPLHELSSIVAYHATQCWGQTCRTKANAASFPLAHNASSRVVRLRAYGNAINAKAAQAFIESVM